jgi:phosphohistidine swiveling domain-containing protein
MKFCVALDGVGPEAELGGKARSLRRLAAAGLAVPRAFVVTTALFRALRDGGPPLPDLATGLEIDGEAPASAALLRAPWPAGFVDELAAALATLSATRFSVRSSATLEDRADALGAGIFLSRTDVAASDVAGAVREVLAAALAPAARAYAARRGLPSDDLTMAVLVHPFTPGDAAGTAAFAPGHQAAPQIETGAGATLAPAARARIDAAARALAAKLGACELEWVATGGAVLFLQLRPFGALTTTAPAWRGASALADATWTWDAAHNPLPLSPAQAGLVAHVDAHCRTPFRQRVVGGYLFYRPLRPAPLASATPAAARDALQTLTRATEEKLAMLTAAATLEDTLAVFSDVYGPLFALVQPAARAARDALAAFLARHGQAARLSALLAGVPSLATERARLAAAIAVAADDAQRAAAVASYITHFGDEAPAWDVAVPTHAEDPSALERLRGAPPPGPTPVDTDAALAAVLPEAARAEGGALLAAARTAAAVAEDDDALYARVQARVRHALLREGRRLQAANVLARAEDVFWLPLEDVRRDARGDAPFTTAAVTRLLAEARAAHAQALTEPPPLPRAAADSRDGVRGRAASGGRAVGRVHLHEPGARVAVPAGAVLVARTLLPTELPLLAPAAIVVETGGPLGHVAAQARERALPAVVDAPGACAAFRAGDLVLVDGDAGVAIRLGP